MDHKTIQAGLRARWVAAVLLVVTLAVGSASTATAAPACATAADEAALNTRVLQTELMVAALSCGEQKRYNSFVTTFKGDLIKGSEDLKTMFKRVYGASGNYQMNAFVTRLANNAAQRTANQPDRYCESSARLLDEVLATAPGSLVRVTAKPELNRLHGFGRC